VLCLLASSTTADELTTVATGAHYPEGPLWYRGQLLYVEYSTSDVKRWDGKHGGTFWHQDGCGPSGLIGRGDNLLVACYDANYLVELSASGRELRMLRTDSSGHRSSDQTTSRPINTAESIYPPRAPTMSRRR